MHLVMAKGRVETVVDVPSLSVLQVHELSELADELQEKLKKAYDTQSTPNQTPLRGVCVYVCVYVCVCVVTPISPALGAPPISIDTPSKHVTLDAEPHGEEFEVKDIVRHDN